VFLFALGPRSITVNAGFIVAVGVLGDQISLALTSTVNLFLCRSWHAQPSETHAYFSYGDLRAIRNSWYKIGSLFLELSFRRMCPSMGSIVPLLILSSQITRLCQAGPVCNGHVVDVYNPVLRASAMQHLGVRSTER